MSSVATAVPTAQRAERLFYLSMAVAIAASVLLGFARSVFLRAWFQDYAHAHAPVEPWFYVHGAFFLIWIGLFATQAALMTAGKPALHRKLGAIAFALIPIMAFLGAVGALIAARRPTGFFDVVDPPLKFLAKPLLDIVMFATLAGLAIAKRGTPQTHKRLMLLATIVLLEAVIVRWPFGYVTSGPDVAFVMKTLFIVPLVVWDAWSRGRVHPATLWGGLFVISAGPLYYLISKTDAWLAFARWSTGLLG
jgi:uncharacterized membrane protein SirB2